MTNPYSYKDAEAQSASLKVIMTAPATPAVVHADLVRRRVAARRKIEDARELQAALAGEPSAIPAVPSD
jgi:hypothetical protein